MSTVPEYFGSLVFDDRVMKAKLPYDVYVSLKKTMYEGGTLDTAVANAVAVTDEVRPQPDDKPDPERELAASFREARSVLDELERAQDGIMADVPAESSVADMQMTQEEGDAGGATDASVPVEPAKE